MAVFGLTTVSAQKTVVAKKNQKVFDVVEQMPEYPGGQAALFEYLSKNIKYPADAEKKKVEGKVFVTFVVDSDGKITDVSLLKKVFPSLDAEAIRVISAMPNWIPGRQKGQAVRVKYTVPIMFRLK
jgi:protein TonB